MKKIHENVIVKSSFKNDLCFLTSYIDSNKNIHEYDNNKVWKWKQMEI